MSTQIFLYMEKIEVESYRLEDSFGAMVNFAITPELRIGYAYDHIISDLKVTSPSSQSLSFCMICLLQRGFTFTKIFLI
jgi:hypothetical protein